MHSGGEKGKWKKRLKWIGDSKKNRPAAIAVADNSEQDLSAGETSSDDGCMNVRYMTDILQPRCFCFPL